MGAARGHLDRLAAQPTDWPGKIEPIPWVYGEIVRRLAEGETVRILVNSKKHKARARSVLKSVGVDSSRVSILRISHQSRLGARFRSDFCEATTESRGKWQSSASIQCLGKIRRLEKRRHCPGKSSARSESADVPRDGRRKEFVLEGGAIDVNGNGTLITTEECLLDQKVQVRNPGFGRAEIETALCANLGVKNILWLGDGIAGDDTHGHVDDLCRFVNPNTAVLCREENSRDANYKRLEQNRERLEGMRLENGGRIEVIPIPMPSPVIFEGQRLPASYANFYISNAAVIVPTFNDPKDREALGILAELFPNRKVVGIHAVDLSLGSRYIALPHAAAARQ